MDPRTRTDSGGGARGGRPPPTVRPPDPMWRPVFPRPACPDPTGPARRRRRPSAWPVAGQPGPGGLRQTAPRLECRQWPRQPTGPSIRLLPGPRRGRKPTGSPPSRRPVWQSAGRPGGAVGPPGRPPQPRSGSGPNGAAPPAPRPRRPWPTGPGRHPLGRSGRVPGPPPPPWSRRPTGAGRLRTCAEPGPRKQPGLPRPRPPEPASRWLARRPPPAPWILVPWRPRWWPPRHRRKPAGASRALVPPPAGPGALQPL